MSHIREISSHPKTDSLWSKSHNESYDVVQLNENLHTDVAIIGAGYTGLSTALHLSEKNIDSVVLDAFEPGWGASGRNGGQVNPTLKHDPEELFNKFGDKANALIDAVSSSADVVYELIDRFNIKCNPIRSGWIQASYTQSGVDSLHKRAEQWRSYGIPVIDLDAKESQVRIGSNAFKGGWLDTRAGSVQPYDYVVGLARVATSLGVKVFSNSPVVSLNKNGSKWVLLNKNGFTVTADKVVIATNGYSDSLYKGLAQTVLSANSFMVSTNALGDKAGHILSKGETMSTAQKLLIYLRKEPDGRLLLGGRGSFSDPSGPNDFNHLKRSLNLIYPDLAPFKFEYHWSGRIAITRDFMPHVHQPEPGLTIALGYNGRGVSMGTAMGKYLANLIATDDYKEFPFEISGIKKIPMHSLQKFYIMAGVSWYSLLDKMSIN